jgi:hypothetical protein
MTDSTEQSGVSLAFTDYDQNYYVIPIEVFERARVPAECTAEIEAALREHEVTGYSPILVGVGLGICGAGLVGSGMLLGAGVAFAGIGAAKALKAYTTEVNDSSTPIGTGDTPTVVRDQ